MHSTVVTEMQATAIVTAADAKVTFPVHRARREPTQVYAQEQLHATTETNRHRATAPFVAPTTTSVYTTVTAAHATTLHAQVLLTNVHATAATTMLNEQQETQEPTTPHVETTTQELYAAPQGRKR